MTLTKAKFRFRHPPSALSKRLVLFLFVLLSASCKIPMPQSAPAPEKVYQHHLLPVPATVEFSANRLTLDANFTYAIKGYRDARLESYLRRTLQRLAARTGLVLTNPADASSSGILLIEGASAAKPVPTLHEDESYSLTIDAQQARLQATTVVSAMRGLETLLQLVEADREGYYFPAVKITDKPRFAWRGLLLDPSRHWLPLEVIKRNLDGMAAVKLNVLHLHLTDDQGFRIEVKRYPKLHQMGSDGLYYTQEQVREIIAYAADRGIRIVPEFDLPAHSTSWLVGYPELASAPGPYEISRLFRTQDGVFDPTRETVYTFLDGFFKEMAALFPDDYIHIGGDENNWKHWSLNEKIVAFREQKQLEDNHALQAYFNQRLVKIISKHGKKMIGWDEILHPDLPKEVTVQSWRDKATLMESAKQGYSVVLASGYYLDRMLTAEEHYLNDPLDANAGLSATEEARILGGEACMWGDHVNAEILDVRIWTRLPAIAERFWSPRETADSKDLYRRLEITSRQLEELGLQHEITAERMMRRVANGKDYEPLAILLSAIEPIDFFLRVRLSPALTTETPFTALVDMARPDNPTRRQLADAVDRLLADAPHFEAGKAELMQMLMRWRQVNPTFEKLSDELPILQEAVPVAQRLSLVSAAAMEAIAALSSGNAPASAWTERKLRVIEIAEKDIKAQVRLIVLPAIKELIIAASESPQLKTMSPSDWRNHVKELAARKEP